MPEARGQLSGSVNESRFNHLVLGMRRRLALPLAVYPGIQLTGAAVRDVVTNPQAQFDAVTALHARYDTAVVLTAMDLSAEVEAFGAAIELPEDEVPRVLGRLVADREGAKKLAVPWPGDKRTAVHLETARRLRCLPGSRMVLGGCIGPFSLAARLAGMTEALELTLTEPSLLHALLEKATQFLVSYVRAFRDAGADGVIMAEPAAGLLSPRGLGEFSSVYVRRIAQAVEHDSFGIMLHNCAAKLAHLPAILDSGVRTFHFGAPMNLVAACDRVTPGTVLCGNLDPTTVFVQMRPDAIAASVRKLLEGVSGRPHFVLSSGCDLPAGTPLENLAAFFAAAGRDR